MRYVRVSDFEVNSDSRAFDGCVSHRCTRHYTVLTLNHNEGSGAECGACILESEQAKTDEARIALIREMDRTSIQMKRAITLEHVLYRLRQAALERRDSPDNGMVAMVLQETEIMDYFERIPAKPKGDGKIHHGHNCAKIPHVGPGYLHDEDDDTPYVIDGVDYCGRCHVLLPDLRQQP